MWHEKEVGNVIQQMYTVPGGCVTIYRDTETDDVEVCLSIHRQSYTLQLFDYFPVSRNKDAILKEVLGVLRAVTFE